MAGGQNPRSRNLVWFLMGAIEDANTRLLRPFQIDPADHPDRWRHIRLRAGASRRAGAMLSNRAGGGQGGADPKPTCCDVRWTYCKCGSHDSIYEVPETPWGYCFVRDTPPRSWLSCSDRGAWLPRLVTNLRHEISMQGARLTRLALNHLDRAYMLSTDEARKICAGG